MNLSKQQIYSIAEGTDQTTELLEYLVETGTDSIDSNFTTWFEYELNDCTFDEDDEMIIALMTQEDLDYAEAETFIKDEDWLVLTDDEAEDKWDDNLDNDLDELILSQIPAHLQFYFDSDAWIRDTKIGADRGNSIATYDGEELEQEVNDTIYFLYRCN